jgi:hypothetical protein
MKKTDIHLTITESIVANKMSKKRYRNGMIKTVHKSSKKEKKQISCESFYQSKQGQREV